MRICVCISVCMCVRVRLRQWGCVCERHVRTRVGAHACVRSGAGSRSCVRACAYICICYYCIVSLYVRAQFVSRRVRTCVCIGVCTDVHANLDAYERAGACACASACV